MSVCLSVCPHSHGSAAGGGHCLGRIFWALRLRNALDQTPPDISSRCVSDVCGLGSATHAKPATMFVIILIFSSCTWA